MRLDHQTLLQKSQCSFFRRLFATALEVVTLLFVALMSELALFLHLFFGELALALAFFGPGLTAQAALLGLDDLGRALTGATTSANPVWTIIVAAPSTVRAVVPTTAIRTIGTTTAVSITVVILAPQAVGRRVCRWGVANRQSALSSAIVPIRIIGIDDRAYRA